MSSIGDIFEMLFELGRLPETDTLDIHIERAATGERLLTLVHRRGERVLYGVNADPGDVLSFVGNVTAALRLERMKQARESALINRSPDQ